MVFFLSIVYECAWKCCRFERLELFTHSLCMFMRSHFSHFLFLSLNWQIEKDWVRNVNNEAFNQKLLLFSDMQLKRKVKPLSRQQTLGTFFFLLSIVLSLNIGACSNNSLRHFQLSTDAASHSVYVCFFILNFLLSSLCFHGRLPSFSQFTMWLYSLFYIIFFFLSQIECVSKLWLLPFKYNMQLIPCALLIIRLFWMYVMHTRKLTENVYYFE